jgi:WD40 repeat protein
MLRYLLFVFVVVAHSFLDSARADFGNLVSTLSASDAAINDYFGHLVAIYGNTAMVSRGNSYSTFADEIPGAVHVYDAATGVERFKLTASDAAPKDGFGDDIGIDGNMAIISASLNDRFGTNTGAAYVFDLITGQELRRLTPSDPTVQERFGSSVDISGNIAVVGGWQQFFDGTGVAYVFDVATGEQLHKLTASDGQPGDRFGASVAISNDIAIIGANGNDHAGNRSGAAYVFDVTTGQELWKLTPSDTMADDGFGQSVGISGNTAIVGKAYYNADGGSSRSVYLFDVRTGKEFLKLMPSDADANDLFGTSVDISSGTAIVSSHSEDNRSSAYLFDTKTGQELIRVHSPSTMEDGFGQSVAISENNAIIGAPFFFQNALNPINPPGTAYIFDIARDPTISGDFNTDGTVDAADYIVWRNGLGATFTQADYAAWRENFGRSADALATAEMARGPVSAPIPEPASALIAAIGAALLASARHHRQRPRQPLPKTGGAVFSYQNTPSRELCLLAALALLPRIAMTVGILAGAMTTQASAAFGDELFKLTASDAELHDSFGSSVYIRDRTAIVGAIFNDDACPTDRFCNSGSAYLYDIITGQEMFKLTAPDAAQSDSFGRHVLIAGDTVFVSASGAAKVYVYDAANGEYLRSLASADAPKGTSFGWGFDIQENIGVFSAPSAYNDSAVQAGAAYLFDITTGQQLSKLTSSDGQQSDRFGDSVAISGNLAIVGSRFHDGAGENSGAAYVFDLTTGQQLRKLTASDAAPGDWFGFKVDISGNTAIVGAPNSGPAGKAYLFDVISGREEKQLAPLNGRDGDQFGWSVGISGDTAVAGARFANNGGRAYLFDVSSGDLLKELAPSDEGGWFGESVAISGNTALVGALVGSKNGIETGSAYLFDVSRDIAAIPGDFNNDGTVDAADYAVWRNGLGATYTQADYDMWRTNFGGLAAGSALAAVAALPDSANPAVPEPTSALLFICGAALWVRDICSHRCTRRHSYRWPSFCSLPRRSRAPHARATHLYRRRRTNTSGRTISSCGNRSWKSRPSGCEASMRSNKWRSRLVMSVADAASARLT